MAGANPGLDRAVFILPEGASRVVGRNALLTNIAVGYAVSEIIRSTLGPNGMNKCMVNDLGDVIITNDGATILEEINVSHPIAKMMVEAAKTQDKQVGDGTTTATLIAGNLLKQAGELIEKNVAPAVIIRGYEKAMKKAQEIIKEKLAFKLNVDEDKPILEQIAFIAMGSKGIGEKKTRRKLAEIVVNACLQVAEKRDGKYVIDKDLIKIEKKAGGDIYETELVNGIVVDKEVVHADMPRYIKEAKIALIAAPLEIEKTEIDAKIQITSPEQMEAFLKQEEKMLKELVEKIKSTGANVVFCQKGIDEVAQHFLAKEGILAVRRVKKSDMEKLSRATGARIVSTVDDLSDKDLGEAQVVEEVKVAGESMIFVRGCKNPKSVTIFVRGGSDHVVSEVERAIVDAIGATSAAIEQGLYVTGGGSVESALSVLLRDYAAEIGGREQLAIQAFADALEIIPATLAENSGMDPIDVLVELRSRHKKGEHTMGVNALEGKVDDMKALGILEPAAVKLQAVASGAEIANMILKVDDVISARIKENKSKGNEEPPEF